MQQSPIKLTTLAHGGGCGCKLAPSVLEKILAGVAPLPRNSNLLVGNESGDDAAVYRLNAEQALVATTDFFLPIVDDAGDFGRIAAANAISDVYAMGGRPIFALALLGMPIAELPPETISAIMQGATDICGRAGISIAGGHSIENVEPLFGLVVLGLTHPDRIKKNSGAKPGDALLLTKPLGIGVLSAAFKKGKLSAAGYETLLRYTTQLNTPGVELSEREDVHALTDVTGFGILGHLLEICRGSAVGAELDWKSLPFIDEALELCRAGLVTGASTRNWDSYGTEVLLPDDVPEQRRFMLCDPQTSGGLLISCAQTAVDSVRDLLHDAGFERAAVVGRILPAEDLKGPYKVRMVF